MGNQSDSKNESKKEYIWIDPQIKVCKTNLIIKTCLLIKKLIIKNLIILIKLMII